MADQEKTDLQAIVEEMRRLGVKEYRKGEVHVVLGEAPMEMTEKSEEEQQRARDKRERELLERQRRVLLAASTRIGPKFQGIK